MNVLHRLLMVAAVTCTAFNVNAKDIVIDFDMNDFTVKTECITAGSRPTTLCESWASPIVKDGITQKLYIIHHMGNTIGSRWIDFYYEESRILSINSWVASSMSSSDYIDRDNSWLMVSSSSVNGKISLNELEKLTVEKANEDYYYEYYPEYRDPTYAKWNWLFDVNAGHIVISSVPEPETYAMLLVGLGLVAQMARRRRYQYH